MLQITCLPIQNIDSHPIQLSFKNKLLHLTLPGIQCICYTIEMGLWNGWYWYVYLTIYVLEIDVDRFPCHESFVWENNGDS